MLRFFYLGLDLVFEVNSLHRQMLEMKEKAEAKEKATRRAVKEEYVREESRETEGREEREDREGRGRRGESGERGGEGGLFYS